MGDLCEWAGSSVYSAAELCSECPGFESLAGFTWFNIYINNPIFQNHIEGLLLKANIYFMVN